MSITLVGRDEELRSIEAFLERVEMGPAGLVLSGEAGIGKTILWEAAVLRCRRNSLVLSCGCLETEASVSFGGLSDLLGDVFEEVAPSLPVPRRHALEVALLLSEPDETGMDVRAIGLAVLDVVRALARRRPLVIAVDDVQWLDSSTSRVLQMALHRLSDEHAGFLATVRERPDARTPFELERSFQEERLSRLSLRGLSLGALHRLLQDRLALELTRPELVRLKNATAGNPFFALELGRELVRTGARPQPRQPLPVPASLATLLSRRLERLPPQSRTALLAVAALASPTVDIVAATLSQPHGVIDALDAAANAGVIEVQGSRIRFTHPLLASTCYTRAPLWQRQEVHRALAAVVQEDEERVRHRALAATGPDAELAADLEASAITTSTRGSIAAAELFDLAADLTPRDDGSESRRRRMAAALFYHHAGDPEHGVAVAEQLLGEAAPGGERADALSLLATIAPRSLRARLNFCDEALVEARGDEYRTTRILATRSGLRAHSDLRGALADGRAAVAKAERLFQYAPNSQSADHGGVYSPLALLTAAIARLAYVETSTLGDTPGLLERGVGLEAELGPGKHVMYWDSPSAMLAHRLIVRDELDRARAILETRVTQLTSGSARYAAHLHLAWLEWLSGRWRCALDHATEALELTEPGGVARPTALQAAGLIEAHLGRVDEARLKATHALQSARATSNEILAIESLGVLGHLELAVGNVEAAARHLRDLPERLVSFGWNDPSSPLWADAIETLIRSGDLDAARSTLELYEERAARASRRSRACAARCRGLLAAAQGDVRGAFQALDKALGETPPPYLFERARTLLALGELQRRSRRRAAARSALEQSLAIFEELDARRWTENAGSELRRISGRRAQPGHLTETEQRVAALAAQGLANKEIAATLFMSVHTVEAHLTHIYRKLGVKSRAALAHRLAAAANDAAKA
jgi:DNA-binding CsgD family transcriptional regulator